MAPKKKKPEKAKQAAAIPKKTGLSRRRRRPRRRQQPRRRVKDMKELLGVEWDVPPSYQISLHGGRATSDTDAIIGDVVYQWMISYS